MIDVDPKMGLIFGRMQQDGLSMFRAISPEIAPGYPDQVAVLKSQASEMLIRGGNRSSKSTVAAVLFAALARDKPVITASGEKIDVRRPWQKGRPLTMWVIGLQMNHIGQTIHRLLFRAGLYNIVPDVTTGLWRTYRPYDKDDEELSAKMKPSWPLIPPSEVKHVSWESSAKRQFECVTLHNGTEIFAFASTSDVKTGDPVDVIWIDEAIENPEHYAEWQMRVPDRKGRIFWSSWPRKGNPALLRLTERAREQAEELRKKERKTVNVEEYVFTFRGNPYIDADEKAKVCEGLSERELAARDFGQYTLDRTRIYPSFDRDIHSAVPDDPALDDAVATILRANNLNAPRDWTHDLILDPGTAKPGVLFCAVPPKILWGGNDPIYVVYKEIYRPRATAYDLAKMISEQKPPGVVFRRFIIDGKAGVQKPLGFSKTIMENYSEFLQQFKLESVETGSGFCFGDPNFAPARMKVEAALLQRDGGRPRLRVVVQNCRNLVWQMETNQLKVFRDQVDEKPEDRQTDDLRRCVEYWISRNPTWVQLPNGVLPGETIYDQFKRWKKELYPEADKEPRHVAIGPAA